MVESDQGTGTAAPLLKTKLYVPKWRTGLVERASLIERLNEGADCKLTLVSAPAGFGKTTLLAEWLATPPVTERPAAWVSLDESDNDPTLFWAYLVKALQTILPGVGERALSLLNSPQPPAVEAWLGTLLNEIVAASSVLSGTPGQGFALVLDDYHVINAQPIHDCLSFLIEHMPPQMQLVIASRAEPPLPLGRLRGSGELSELRAADLRFTTDEAVAFLNNVMGLSLIPSDVAALESRIEGWIAGLQLAALSMKGRDDVASFIRNFAGDDRYIVDYLVQEVLQRQTERVRMFLLQTSILDRLSGPLCDAVTGQVESKGLLEALERANLFVVPLDDKRQWYRYHHLFADVLRTRLIDEQADEVPVLHSRASEWFERNGTSNDAIRHAIASEDFDRAAVLVELAWAAIHRSFEDATFVSWAKALPENLIRARPVLSAGYGWTLLVTGDLEGGDARLRDAEMWLDPAVQNGERQGPAGGNMIVADKEQFRSLPATISAARAFHSQATGDIPGTEKHAKRALELLSEDKYFERAIPSALFGLACWTKGDLGQAEKLLAESMAGMRKSGNALLSISGAGILAEMRMGQGRLRDAVRAVESSLQLARGQGEPAIQGTADLYVALAELCIERNDMKAATEHILRSEELGEQAAQEYYQYRSRIAKARSAETQGDLDAALEFLDEAESVYTPGVVPDIRPVAALRARVWIAQARLPEVMVWARDRGLSADDDLSYLREFEHIILAKALIARYRSDHSERSIDSAERLLDRLLRSAQDAERTGSVIEILLQQALAHEARGKMLSALAPLERALLLAEPEGYVRAFVDQGEPMRGLLRRAIAAGIALPYCRKLLSALDEGRDGDSLAAADQNDLADPLTTREIEVMRLISAGMRNQEIADQLFISLATVKRHIANAYGKLAVTHRTEAVARANELNLL